MQAERWLRRVKAFVVPADYLSLIPGSTGRKRADSRKLSSDLHRHRLRFRLRLRHRLRHWCM